MSKTRKVILILTAVLFFATAWAVAYPPAVATPEKIVAVTYHGHHATYVQPAIYHDSHNWLYAFVTFGWMCLIQGGIPMWFYKPRY